MVTFSDCMTLLLCFFVMLLSFSSFDPKDLSQVFDSFDLATRSSVFPNPRPPREALLPELESVVDRTQDGSEMPTYDRLQATRNPRAPRHLTSDDAYGDRRVLSIPSDVLFWGRGAALKPQAADLLAQVAQFLRLMPCRVVVAESPGAGMTPDQSLGRAMAVAAYLTDAEGLPAERFAVSAPAPAEPTGEQAVLRIAMLNREVYP
jgi:flagellar motor protein MotB